MKKNILFFLPISVLVVTLSGRICQAQGTLSATAERNVFDVSSVLSVIAQEKLKAQKTSLITDEDDSQFLYQMSLMEENKDKVDPDCEGDHIINDDKEIFDYVSRVPASEYSGARLMLGDYSYWNWLDSRDAGSKCYEDLKSPLKLLEKIRPPLNKKFEQSSFAILKYLKKECGISNLKATMFLPQLALYKMKKNPKKWRETISEFSGKLGVTYQKFFVSEMLKTLRKNFGPFKKPNGTSKSTVYSALLGKKELNPALFSLQMYEELNGEPWNLAVSPDESSYALFPKSGETDHYYIYGDSKLPNMQNIYDSRGRPVSSPAPNKIQASVKKTLSREQANAERPAGGLVFVTKDDDTMVPIYSGLATDRNGQEVSYAFASKQEEVPKSTLLAAASVETVKELTGDGFGVQGRLATSFNDGDGLTVQTSTYAAAGFKDKKLYTKQGILLRAEQSRELGENVTGSVYGQISVDKQSGFAQSSQVKAGTRLAYDDGEGFKASARLEGRKNKNAYKDNEELGLTLNASKSFSEPLGENSYLVVSGTLSGEIASDGGGIDKNLSLEAYGGKDFNVENCLISINGEGGFYKSNSDKAYKTLSGNARATCDDIFTNTNGFVEYAVAKESGSGVSQVFSAGIVNQADKNTTYLVKGKYEKSDYENRISGVAGYVYQNDSAENGNINGAYVLLRASQEDGRKTTASVSAGVKAKINDDTLVWTAATAGTQGVTVGGGVEKKFYLGKDKYEVDARTGVILPISGNGDFILGPGFSGLPVYDAAGGGVGFSSGNRRKKDPMAYASVAPECFKQSGVSACAEGRIAVSTRSAAVGAVLNLYFN